MNVSNAIISETMLGREDHGILTFFIFIETDGCGCGVGGYALDEYNENTRCRVIRPEGLECISNILDVVGVSTWEDLPGKYIRVVDNGWGTITKIGNILKDEWFDLQEFFTDK